MSEGDQSGKPPRPPAPAVPSWAPAAVGLSPKVLIVEDDSLIALSIKLCVERFGYQVCGMAASGGRALDLAAATLPDIALMDVRLKGEMDGVTAAELIIQRHGIPVIFVTAFHDQQTVSRTKAIGAAGLVFKPFLPEQLGRTMGRALGL